jgi:hypothetical protein
MQTAYSRGPRQQFLSVVAERVQGRRRRSHAREEHVTIEGSGNVTRICRDGLVFVTWIGDHRPRHVHIYQDGRPVLKWNLEANVPMEGVPSRRMVRTIHELQLEGLL